MPDILQEWSQLIKRAMPLKTTLRFRGGGTKDFYSQSLEGEVFDTRAYAGILSYEPSELVVTVRGYLTHLLLVLLMCLQGVNNGL